VSSKEKVMKGYGLVLSVVVLGAATLLGAVSPAVAPQAGGGTIKGHIKIVGKLPGNRTLRMGVDPKCGALNKGKTPVQEEVKATIDGSLANVFVRLEGKFPGAKVPTTPVVIDQQSCFYSPRVAGVMVGQPLQIKNSDNLLHNVHSVTEHAGNNFNFGQPNAGSSNSLKMKEEDVMLKLGCDVHNWMRAYVGVVTNPYYAVSDASGNFTISGVPPGTYTIDAWHERFGPTKKSITVTAGGTVTADFAYMSTEK